jgi:hypothetical protein
MATELVASIGPRDFQRETSMGTDDSVVLMQPVGVDDIRGVSLPKFKTNNFVNNGYISSFRIPANLTMGTGLTFKVYVTDDRANSVDVGTKVYVGIVVKRLSADETFDIDASAGTEVLASITLSSTAGGIAIGSIAIVNASLDSAVVGDLVLMRIRRKGTDATNDTCPGRVVLMRVEVQNT